MLSFTDYQMIDVHSSIHGTLKYDIILALSLILAGFGSFFSPTLFSKCE